MDFFRTFCQLIVFHYFSVDDSDSLSECRGLSPSPTAAVAATPTETTTPRLSAAPSVSFKLNGGSNTTIVASSSLSQRTNGQFTSIATNGFGISNGHGNGHAAYGATQKNDQTYRPKTATAAESLSSSSCSSSTSSLAQSSTRTSSSTLNDQHKSDATMMMSMSSCSSNSTGSISRNGAGANGTADYVNGFDKKKNGGQGSPLRTQLGLNLKSNAPAKIPATKPSPLQVSRFFPFLFKCINFEIYFRQCPLCPYSSDSSSVLEEHINRSHFDPLSPSVNNSSSAAVAGAVANGSHQMDTLTALACPICCRAFESASDLELHVNIEHR